MKKLLFILLCSAATAAGPIIDSYRFAAVGGPDLWYDVGTVAGGDANQLGSNGTAQQWHLVTIGAAGTCTKLRIRTGSFVFGPANVKMALYTNAGNLIAGATGVVSCTVADTYYEVTLGTPAAVTATTYYIGWCCDSGNFVWRQDDDVGGQQWYDTVSTAYASYPYATITNAASVATKPLVSAYVD